MARRGEKEAGGNNENEIVSNGEREREVQRTNIQMGTG